MAEQHFEGHVPDDRLYDLETDMWVERASDGSVRIGATSLGLWRAGEVIAFTAKPRGAEVEARRGLGTIECAKTVLAVRSPIALRLVEANEAAEERAALVDDDPYGAGWMVRGEPLAWEADAARLVDARAYCDARMREMPHARLEVR